MVRVEIAVLCREFDGEFDDLDIQGVFKTRSPQSYPANLDAFSAVFRIEVPMSMAGRHRFQIDFIDEDGRKLGQLMDDHKSFVFEDGEIEQSFNFYCEFHQNQRIIPKPGRYSVSFRIDGDEVAFARLQMK